MVKETLVILLVVNSNGDVKETRHHSIDSCKQASSLVINNRTVEEQSIFLAKQAAEQAASQAKLELKYPPHFPSKEEKGTMKESQSYWPEIVNLCSPDAIYWELKPDGLLHPFRVGAICGGVGVHIPNVYVKFAKCFVEPGAKEIE